MIGAVSFVLLLVTSCWTCLDWLSSSGEDELSVSAVAGDTVNLERVLEIYKDQVKKGEKDLENIERVLNADKKAVPGDRKVDLDMAPDGSVVGFYDEDGNNEWSPMADKLVFKLEADPQKKELYATDRYNRHFRIGLGDILGVYLISRMFDGHRSYYHGYHPYDYTRFESPGYYHRVIKQRMQKLRSTTRSVRRSSSGPRGWSTTRSSSGGWRSGK